MVHFLGQFSTWKIFMRNGYSKGITIGFNAYLFHIYSKRSIWQEQGQRHWRGWGGRGGRKDIAPPIFSEQKGKKGEKRKKRKTFKAETLKSLSLSSKCYCFSHSWATRIQIFFLGQPCWLTILVSVPWSLHFEIHFADPEENKMIKKTCEVSTCLIS